MSLPQLWRSLCGFAKDARLEEFTCHNARRTYITTLLSAGHPVVHVQKAVGHASPVVTASYSREPEQARAKMAGSIPAPF